MSAEIKPLLRVCSLLNEEGVKYMIVGGYACILHGVLRTTNDVDILIPEGDEGNFLKVRSALARLEDGAAAELTLDDFKENLVLKIADEVEVDVSTRAWKVSYDEALPNAKSLVFEGITIPFIGKDELIASKTTYREKDAIDIVELKLLDKNKREND